MHYATGSPFGSVLFVINLRFHGLAVHTMGWAFTLKSFVAVGAESLFTELVPSALRFELLHPLFAGLMGGFLIGVGLLMLF